LSTCLCFGVIWLSDAADEPVVFLSNSVARIYATLLGFVIVFRTTMALGRFYEGVSLVQMMFSKWRDAFIQLCAFAECSIAQHAAAGKVDDVEQLLLSKARLLHWFSLLSALAVQELQVPHTGCEAIDELEEDSDCEASQLCVRHGPTNRMGTSIDGAGRRAKINVDPNSPSFCERSLETSPATGLRAPRRSDGTVDTSLASILSNNVFLNCNAFNSSVSFCCRC